MGIHAAIPLIAALANVVIWVATLSHGANRRVIRLFSVLCLCVASWNMGMFSLYYFPDPESAEWWSRIFRVGMIFAAPVAYHFATVLAPGDGRWPRVIRVCGYVIATLFSIAEKIHRTWRTAMRILHAWIHRRQQGFARPEPRPKRARSP